MGSFLGDGAVPTDLRSLYESHGQGQVFEYVDKGVVKGKDVDALVQQLQTINPARVNELYKATVTVAAAGASTLRPIEPIESVARLAFASEEEKGGWYSAGLRAVAEGKVGVIVLSGGQGTRLGFSGPKGMYDIGLPSGKTLFQLQAERLRRVCTLADEMAGAGHQGGPSGIPWYIMTSALNDKVTREFFAQHDYFGVPKEDITFFPQGTLPCLTPEGKIMLESAGKVAEAPDGNGGIYPALQRTGALADMRKRGVEHLHVFSIDNALVRVADPHFIGYCATRGADCGNKSVWKTNPDEKVGVVVTRGGRPAVVEYSEMDPEACARTEASSGRLVFGAGNICNHYFSRAFLEDTVIPNLGDMYHIARKKIPGAAGELGETCKPQENNGMKLESFIFDVFPLSQKMAVFESPREDEFAPVKNAPGSDTDSPDTARAMISEQAKRWVSAAGATLAPPGEGGGGCCEVSPLVSYGGEGLEERVRGRALEVSFHLE